MKFLFKNLGITLLIIVLFFLVGMPTLAIAQTVEYVPLVPLPGVELNGGNNLSGYLSALFRIGIGVAAVLAVIMIMIGGFQYMGSDSVTSKSEGRERITGAILGLMLLLFSVVLLQTIYRPITSLQLNVPTPQVPIGPTAESLGLTSLEQPTLNERIQAAKHKGVVADIMELPRGTNSRDIDAFKKACESGQGQVVGSVDGGRKLCIVPTQ